MHWGRIGLLPIFVTRNLTTENFKRFSNKTKDKFITLDLFNRSFYNTTTIRKNQEFAYSILKNEEEEGKKLTRYKIINQNIYWLVYCKYSLL